MAYYDNRHSSNDRYGGTQQVEVASHTHGGRSGTRDKYYRDHPSGDYGYDYGRDPYYRRSMDGVYRSHSAAGYHEDPGYYRSHVRRSRRYDDRRDRDNYSHSRSTSRSPPRRHRSSSDRAPGASGLGSAAVAASRSHGSGRGRSRGRDRRSYSYSPSPSRASRPHSDKGEQRITQAVKAALTAGAIEAFRVRKEPGEWTGAKGRRVLTAAITAGGTDGLVDRDPSRHSKRHIIESTLTGLATNRIVNGSRSHSRSRKHSSRSHSHGRSGAKDAALAGILAAAGKEAYDRFRSKDQNRDRHRSSSRDSYDHDSTRPHRSKKRSKSVTDYLNEGIEALGFKEGDKGKYQDRDDRSRRHHRSSRHVDSSDDGRYSDSDYSRRQPSPSRGGRHSREVSRSFNTTSMGNRGDEGYGYGYGYGHLDTTLSRPQYSRSDSRTLPNARSRARHGSKKNNNPDSDSENSTDEDKKQRKLNKETLWARGLGHSRHHPCRTHSLAENKPAAASIHGAVSEWNHVDKKRRERTSFQKERESKKTKIR
ncbi:hypothetical protein AOCH_007239 [Aspergillus ochraceoroseus]|uniref:DUF3824 domain-containing protein n=1 Tax=Aspergillus ochraceoroseus TaxID=138278 RepID=A0A0F8U6S0_9EURO|nr:hypothetical protein AOCH_007239 [Aspergillus ochraceoroseus]